MSSQNDSDVFSVRIVTLDYYMSPPIPDLDYCYSSFHGTEVKEVPVIRIFGATPAGQKTCLHVHRALPYFYIPFPENLLQSPKEGHTFIHTLFDAIEKALRHKPTSKRQHVHFCTLVRAKNFYGFHSSEEVFVKIILYYPHDISRAATFLLDGSILGKSFQPFESHIPYLLQFMVDYNLYGMSHLHTSKVKFRSPLTYCFNDTVLRQTNYDMPATQRSYTCEKPKLWLPSTVPDSLLWPDFTASLDSTENKCIHLTKRQSICQLEADASVDDIINVKFKIYSSLSQTGFEVKMVQSLVPIWEEEFERSGVQEGVKQVDPKRPHPDNALRFFLQGFDYDKALSDFYIETCNTFPTSIHEIDGDDKLAKYMNSINDISPKVELVGHQQYKMFCVVDLLGKEDGQRSKGTSSQSLKVGLKRMDTDALGLLSWLASSQAGEELDAGDELLQGAILSSLLPGNPMALEIANRDYENASQLECQDILDSVEDILKLKRSMEQPSSSFQGLIADSIESIFKSEGSKEQHLSSSQDLLNDISSGFVIPQVDGSFNENLEIQKEIYSEKNVCCGGENSAVQPGEMGPKICLTGKEQKLWSTLPFSVNKFKHEASKAFSPVSSAGVQMETDGLYSPFHNKEGNWYDALNKEIGLENPNVKHGKSIGLCSVRDLMRKKRCLRGEQAEAQVQKNEDIAPDQKVELTPATSKIESLIFPVEDPSEELSAFSGFKGTQYLERLSFPCYTPSVQKSFSSPGAGLQLSTCVRNICGVNQGSITNEVKESKALMNLAAEYLPMQKTKSKELFEVSDIKPARSVSCSFLAGVCGDERYVSPNIMRCLSIKNSETSENDALKSLIHDDLNSSYVTKKYASVPDGSIAEEVLLPELHPRIIQHSVCLFDESTKNFSKEKASDEFFLMTFVNRSPLNLHIHDPEVSLPVSRTDQNIDEKQGMKNIMPFFSRTCQDLNLCDQNVVLSQDLALGIPTHFQNDGSVLYLLTHVLSPPTLNSVYDWLSGGKQLCLVYARGASYCKKSPTTLVDGSLCDSSQLSEGKVSLETETFDFKIAHASREPKLDKFPAKAKVTTDDLHDFSQISGPEKYKSSNPTPLSQIGFRDPASFGFGQQLTLISMELHAESRGDLRPDPKFDAINFLCLIVQEDASNVCQIYVLLHVDDQNMDEKNGSGVFDCKLFFFTEEKLLLEHFVEMFSYLDPDILMGWEIQRSSLGYLAERAAYLGMDLLNKISRTPAHEKIGKRKDSVYSEFAVLPDVAIPATIIEDEWGRTHASGLHVGGRIVLNIWRLMRTELKLNLYTAEAVAEQVLRQKIPLFSNRVLNQWYLSGIGRARHNCIEYVIARSMLNIRIMGQLDMINRTSELSRIFGIEYFSVISRGSQYRVESMLLRLAHTQNYLAISPGYQQVALQPAMECLPLVMEPESGFYVDPVVVLDFQSLYPSMIIAYNLCFCTCLGKVKPSRENVLGVSSYFPYVENLKYFKEKLLLTPNGVVYVPAEVRKGVLPRLLEEILSTRIMVKQTMKKLTSSELLLNRILNARQLALKLIANVTYGYTAAGFSGRMPCAEIADSIVQCGRKTLETAISFVNQNEKWKAKVIYGDTDSMFVLLKGRSKEDAFVIGNEIASKITAMNPEPVTLKMEKVYQPCFLLTKKRYVGYSYESPKQEKPTFDAKGIETVRRDNCPAVTKTLEHSIRLFFESRDLSEVKSYLKRQWTRILSGKTSLKDFIFAKEVRLGSYRGSSLPPAAIVARKSMQLDPRSEPHYGERVPYVVVHGEPGSRLMDMVVDPSELLDLNSPYRPNDSYYIKKQMIPALQRVFGLLGADVNKWYSAIPRPTRPSLTKRIEHISHSRSVHEDYSDNPMVSKKPHVKRSRIDRYYSSKHCSLCGDLIQPSDYFCEQCSRKASLLAAAVVGKTSKKERELQHLTEICRHCGGGDWIAENGVKCTSLACSVFYERRKVQKELTALSSFATETGFYPPCNAELF